MLLVVASGRVMPGVRRYLVVQAMMNLMRLQVITILLMLFVGGSSAEGQATNHNVFGGIPESRRGRLIERLNLAVEYQRNGNWVDIYDLLDHPISLPDNPNVSREQYVEQNRRLDSFRSSVLLEFTPADVIFTGDNSEGFAVVFGCGNYRERRRTVKYKSQAEIYLRGGEWYFSAIPGPSLGIHSGPFPCKK